MSEHEWFHENLTLYGAGLAAEECLRIERHAAQCPACAQELAQWRLFDQGLGRLCAPVHFAANWDERVLCKGRGRKKPGGRWPALARWAVAAAAVLFIGVLGAAVHSVAQLGFVAFPGGDRLQAEASLPTVLPVFGMEAHGALDSREPQVLFAAPGTQGGPADLQNSNTIDFFPPALALTIRAPSQVHTSISGDIIGGKNSKKDESALLSGEFTPFGNVNRNLGVKNLVSGLTPAGTLTPEFPSGGEKVPDGGKVTMGGFAYTRGGDTDGDLTRRLEGLQQLQEGDMKHNLNTALATGHYGNAKAPPANTPPASVAAGAPRPENAPAKVGQVLIVGNETTQDRVIRRSGAEKALDSGSKKTDVVLKSSTEYYNPQAKGQDAIVKSLDKVVQDQKSAEKVEDRKSKEKAGGKREKYEVSSLPGGNEPTALQQPKPPEPQVAQRKIIRTGDLEFEVDVFDNAVSQITGLINAIPGAFVATINSEKLPNGKVKGSVVVRVPPEHLDKFVLDLRKDLAKTGELKSQRIGSSDVTKQYTDIESRLRAARTMEERMIAIIKNGKGDVKDLVAAEAQLGVWRTKIEEMEGEIRFYNNQVGLSTLTITAYEKEIRAAAAMVITEQVTMKIEADDVEKSLQTALAAVTEAKGRVTKSDLKQHAAGQLEAILQFEVSPAAAPTVKDKLKALGVVTHHDAQRLQQAEGGTAPKGEPLKSRTNDVQYTVTLYNVANIQPRKANVLQIVVTDVPAEYYKLLVEVKDAKGQVRVSQLDEKEKFNTFAQLDFDVPSTQRDLFDKVLKDLGDVVSRNTTQAGPGETATDRKLGYRLTLKSVTSVPPREMYTLVLYSHDVPAAYKALQVESEKVKGHVRALQLNEQDKNNINAQFDVDIPKGYRAALDKLLEELGDTASRTASRVQPGEIATELKVGYRLTLRSQVPPRETVALGLEVSDVIKVSANLVELVKNAKGKVTASQINKDSTGRETAFQLFDVPLAAKEDLVKKFSAIGKVRAQKATQNLQAPDGKLATAHIDVTLTNQTPIVPGDEGLYANLRNSLAYAVKLLSVSLMFVIVGISVLLPWALLVWIGVKLVRRARSKVSVGA